MVLGFRVCGSSVFILYKPRLALEELSVTKYLISILQAQRQLKVCKALHDGVYSRVWAKGLS